ILDAEVEGVAGEMVVPVDADRGIADGRDQGQSKRQDHCQPLRQVRPCRRRSHLLLMRRCFDTGRAAFSPPGPMLDRPLSLVIPAHNEAPNMTQVIGASIVTLDRLAPDWEIVLVDDGSTDDTVVRARAAMGAAESRLLVISHDGKGGTGFPVSDGLRAAPLGYVAFMDCDGQFYPADLNTLAGPIPPPDLAAG